MLGINLIGGLLIGVVVGTIAAIVATKTGNPLVKFTLGIAGALLGLILSPLLGILSPPHKLSMFGPPVYSLILSLVLAIVLVCIPNGRGAARPAGAQTAIGYTDAGEPIYSIVGYTSDGKPVTADRVSGSLALGLNSRTNSLAIVALILGLTVAPIAIPFGHVARSQIKNSGERGDGLALAGLVLGYLSLASIVIVAFALLAH